ncbi:hypothetical protein [Vreelandella massiliensis]|uniref:hypothetical protein n=1 Tax=Vreelandella massiliensis TaxID=1816686 RepID=UPI00096AB378|nr:hypothetical protein [Halomonas massiliensis]
MSRGFQQVSLIDDLGDDLPYLRGELIHRLRGMAKGRVLRMLETAEGEALFIQQMNRVYVYPRFSDLVGEASTERVPYTVDLGEKHGQVTIDLPTPERLMDLLLLNFYSWQSYTIFSTPNRKVYYGHVWMAADKPDELTSSLGVVARSWPSFNEWILNAEQACQESFTPLASRLSDASIPPLLKNQNPGDLRAENLLKREKPGRGRPMRCVVCRQLTTREASDVVKKERICFECLHYQMKWRSL